ENARTIELLEQAASDGLPFSVILLDAKMPGVDGTEIARQIRRNLLSADIPIVMMCPGGKPDNFEELKTIGVSEYIVKPIKQSQLFDKLVSVLSSRHARKIVAVSAPDHFVPSVKRHLKILLAEDNPVNQRLTIRLLEKVGHAVRLAKSGKEALEAIAHEKFDAVLMDIQMPELDGLAATRIIREAEKDTASHIPIIALTAHAMAGDKEKCLKAGTDAYLSKPIRLQELVETIESLVHS
ncbi:MAG: response regulator, partial [Desulfomonilaceae bacterium]